MFIQKLGIVQDAIFRRILGVSKDVALIERRLNELLAEFSGIEEGGFELKKLAEYLPQLNQKVNGMKQDLEVFLRIVNELNVDSDKLADVLQHKKKTISCIKVKLDFFKSFII